MKLLICTQAVDLDDPVLGFFHRWVEELAKRCERVSVICLREGRHRLPENVRVYSLGKESGVSRVKYTFRFYKYIWSLRGGYDSVFVHMNQEYVLLGSPVWRLLKKRVVLWRNHKKGSFLTWAACGLVHAVCHTSPEAFVAKYKNTVQMPIGVDTSVFCIPETEPASNSILFLGRLDPVKNPDIFIESLKKMHSEGLSFRADIIGEPTPGNEKYGYDIRDAASELVGAGVVEMHPGVSHMETPRLYASHSLYVNLTSSGSFDKTIGEAMASGCVVVAANAAVKDVVGDMYVSELNVDSVVAALKKGLQLNDVNRRMIRSRGREYMERTHALSLLTERLFGILAA